MKPVSHNTLTLASNQLNVYTCLLNYTLIYTMEKSELICIVCVYTELVRNYNYITHQLHLILAQSIYFYKWFKTDLKANYIIIIVPV